MAVLYIVHSSRAAPVDVVDCVSKVVMNYHYYLA